jgi:hypothetical protein
MITPRVQEQQAERGFRLFEGHKQLRILRAALLWHRRTVPGEKLVASKNVAA